jgi:hypothetical protein
MQSGFNIKEIDMKDVKNILETVFDRLFNFGSFMIYAAILVVFLFVTIIKQEYAETALTRATTKACYDGGLIKVDTDAGSYCVAPANLVKVEVK